MFQEVVGKVVREFGFSRVGVSGKARDRSFSQSVRNLVDGLESGRVAGQSVASAVLVLLRDFFVKGSEYGQSGELLDVRAYAERFYALYRFLVVLQYGDDVRFESGVTERDAAKFFRVRIRTGREPFRIECVVE